MSTAAAAASARRKYCYGHCASQERLCIVLGYAMAAVACCISQESINVSAVPMAPQVFFQPLSSRLAYPEFNKQCEQCEQQDNWRCEQDEKQYSCYKEGSLLSLGAPFLVLLTP